MLNKFHVIPAIDIRGGKCVRLFQGDYQKETVYYDNPVEVAHMWKDKGAKVIHVVDLDGAKQGSLVNIKIVKELAKLGVDIEFGGGVRSLDDVKTLKDSGVAYCILGSKAIGDDEFILKALDIYKDKLVVGIDAKNGKVAIAGWLEETKVTAIDLAIKMDNLGIQRIIYTDIMTDGAFVGPNISGVKEILKNTKNIWVTASGGVSSYEDIKKVIDIKDPRVWGVIVGKALYEGKIDLGKL